MSSVVQRTVASNIASRLHKNSWRTQDATPAAEARIHRGTLRGAESAALPQYWKDARQLNRSSTVLEDAR